MSKIKTCFIVNTNDIDVKEFFTDFHKIADNKTLVISFQESTIATDILKDLGVKDFEPKSVKSLIMQLTDISIDTGKIFDVLQDVITTAYEAQVSVPETIILLIQTRDINRIKPTLNYVLPNISDDIDPVKSVYLKKVFSKDYETTKKNITTDFTYKFDLGESDDSIEKAASTLFDLIKNDEK